MRADRLLHLLMLLQQSDRCTSRQLASRLEVSERTIHRDMEALSASGIPVMADRGTGGGWYLPPGYRSLLTGINKDDVRTLLLPQLAGPSSDPAWSEAFARASRKLLAALPADWRKEAEEVRRRIHVDGAGWYDGAMPSDAAAFLRLLQEAIWAGRKVRIRYGTEQAEASERILHPWGLVIKGTIWYLVAYVEDPDLPAQAQAQAQAPAPAASAVRTYRVSRIREAALLAESASGPPEDFDLAAYWDASVVRFKEQLPVYPAVLQADASLLPRLRAARFLQVAETKETGQGFLRIHVRFHTLESAASILLPFAGEVRVLEPEELRTRIREAAASILAAYDSPAR
ncbi:helix-turn-helix transcriptional regulator [Gorillibacterium sp. sgz5001074]|uniref:helix-turn-helix transcriptional regulator n=1 Tax=Gorillibacterium sp. sgz5001074 TaxID=3446695 RepID=UPI003F66B0F3